MGVPTSDVGYTSATARRGDHEVHKGHVVVLENNNNNINQTLGKHPKVDTLNNNFYHKLFSN
jgi:hypothetical protein